MPEKAVETVSDLLSKARYSATPGPIGRIPDLERDGLNIARVLARMLRISFVFLDAVLYMSNDDVNDEFHTVNILRWVKGLPVAE